MILDTHHSPYTHPPWNPGGYHRALPTTIPRPRSRPAEPVGLPKSPLVTTSILNVNQPSTTARRVKAGSTRPHAVIEYRQQKTSLGTRDEHGSTRILAVVGTNDRLSGCFPPSRTHSPRLRLPEIGAARPSWDWPPLVPEMFPPSGRLRGGEGRSGSL